MVPYLLAGTGKSATDDSLSTILCVANGLGLLFLILAALFSIRALRVPRPTLSSSQATQTAAAAQADVSAAAAELQAKQAEIETLRRAASRDPG
jgi:hypothetical protein